MATPEDMRANAEYIRLADEVVDVPGGANNNNYANINLICQIAESNMVDAVMPLWGHASENPALPTSLLSLKHRVSFIGPPAEPMYALGDKIGSTIIAQSAGVPVIGWNGDDIRVDYKSEGITDETYAKANVLTGDDALACANRVGYPVMIKASEGGGGKGIRKVHKPEEVANMFRQVQAEIPGSPIFVMRMAKKARHLEVQLLADKYGDAIALSGRDCSVQRRHQKIIEEGPPVAAPIELFKRMEKAAIALAKTVGYCNAGTVEYLYLEETQEFAFLELNPRLQVEHPVTENILGLNLPSCQLMVAMGVPLHRIGGIRKMYGRNPLGTDTIDYEYSERVVNPRHCVAVRITAENPESAFQPTSGDIHELKFMSNIDVWGYFSVDSSGSVHEFADSQFGHIFASGPDRESARKACIVALKELQIRGDIRTTTEYIIKLMQSDDFVNNKIDTDWLDGRLANHKLLSIEEGLKFSPPHDLVAACGAALQGYQFFESRDKDFIDNIKVGQVPSKDILNPEVVVDLIFNNTKYSTSVIQTSPQSVIIICNGESQKILIRPLADGGYLLNVAGKSHLAYSKNETGGALRMTLDGHTCMFTPEYDPTKLLSSGAGKFSKQLVENGSHVEKGEPYAEVEVMKMYMPLKTEEAGTVHFQISEGATLGAGDVIALVTLDNPDKVIKADVYSGTLTFVSDEDSSNKNRPHLQLREAQAEIEYVMAGFPQSDSDVANSLSTLMTSIVSPMTPYYELEEAMSVLRGRINGTLSEQILSFNKEYKESVEKGTHSAYPAKKIIEALFEFSTTLDSGDRSIFNTQTSHVWNVAEPYLYSAEIRIMAKLTQIVETYLEVETMFDKLSYTDVVTEIRKSMSDDLPKILRMCQSHANLLAKNFLLVKVIEEMKSFPLTSTFQPPKLANGNFIRNEINIRHLKMRLGDLTKLSQNAYSHVSFSANLLLMEQYSLKPELRRERLNEAITSALTTGDSVGEGDRLLSMEKFVQNNIVIRDLLLDSLQHDKDYRIASMEIYIRKIYRKTHSLKNMMAGNSLADDEFDGSSWIRFEFETKSVYAVTNNSVEKKLPSERLSYNDLASLASRPRAGSNPNAPSSPNKNSSSISTPPLTPSASNGELDMLAPPPFYEGGLAGDRTGIFAVIDSFDKLPSLFPHVIAKIGEEKEPSEQYVNAIHVVLLRGLEGGSGFDDECAAQLGVFLASQKDDLKKKHVRRVTFLVGQKNKKTLGNFGSVFTFRAKTDFKEDRLFRQIEAPHAYHLDLPQLSKFNLSLETGVQTTTGNVHIYRAVPAGSKGPSRYFARLVSFSSDVNTSDAETLFVEALDSLGLVIGQAEAQDPTFRKKSAANHIFLNVVAPDHIIDPKYYESELRRICTKYWYKMVRLSVSTVELKLTCKINTDSETMHLRLIASNPTGFVLKIDNYYEANENGNIIFKSVSGTSKGALDGLPTNTPYKVSELFEQQRSLAMASSDTLYAYDWPMVFENAAQQQWEEFNSSKSSSSPPLENDCVPFVSEELIMCSSATNLPMQKGWLAKDAESNGVLKPMNVEPGQNDCGMVAWLATFRSPEYPNGRKVVLICNDITYQAGSFGTKEDIFFFKASEYARTRGIPRIYLAANSGARIGMAQSLKNIFKVCWTDDNDPQKGYKYIYLDKSDYDSLKDKYATEMVNFPVNCTQVKNEPNRYMITDIIGEESDLGVENLMGSGLIAGETSRAYDEIFTLTMVVGRTVGIGAYLVRLGQRTIQRTRNSPIILTGYQALNKLMGKEIYTTNDQLGGPMIMYPNGVSHLLAETHMDSVLKALNWLSFVPSIRGGHLPLRDPAGVDTVDRLVEFSPQKGVSYDPRMLCTGMQDPCDPDKWISGFFDHNSFVEALAGWAKTVVTGRGRLGGIPMGVIITENRTSEALKPADPADITSQEKMVQQAGGVWFPDSAYKTAQALRDFNREGLPCMIFANWRGFSGGQRDMFDEVLKFGSMIVDALVAYQQPLFVYIPPFAELRGGAWVVVDHTINADVMEFYAAENARGGVLEAAGAASIKFRDRDVISTSHRIDAVLQDLDKKLLDAKKDGDESVALAIGTEIKTREKMIFGVYQQVAVHFADLHDTPGRMKAKGVIRKQIDWKSSRSYFFWRLRRRLTEFDLASTLSKDSIAKLKPSYRTEIIAELKSWFLSKGGDDETWGDDRKMILWLTHNSETFQQYVKEKKANTFAKQLSEKVAESDVDHITSVLSKMSQDDQKKIAESLKACGL